MNNITLVEILTGILATLLVLKVVSVKLYMFKEILTMRKQKGQSLVEYALILALVSLVCFCALTNLGQALKRVFINVNVELQRANGVQIVTPVTPPVNPPIIPPHCNDGHGHDNLHGRCL